MTTPEIIIILKVKKQVDNISVIYWDSTRLLWFGFSGIIGTAQDTLIVPSEAFTSQPWAQKAALVPKMTRKRSVLNAFSSFSCPTLGITADKYGTVFFVDGTMIRRIDQNGIISTLLGFNDLTSARPLSCDSVMDISQVHTSAPPDLPPAAWPRHRTK